MDVTEGMNYLGLLLEDSEKSVYTDPFKLRLLNNNQILLAQLLPKDYLTELEVAQETVTVSFGAVDIPTGLTYEVLGGAEGILAVKISGGLWARKIDISEVEDAKNIYLQGDAANPLCYVFGSKIYILPSSTTSVDVYYLKIPSTLYYEFTHTVDSPASTTVFLSTETGLVATTDYYENAVIYSLQHSSYHVVTNHSYVAGAHEFTVEPAAAGNFTDGRFRFITHSFAGAAQHGLDLRGSISDLNPSLHGMILTLSASEGWLSKGKLPRREAVLDFVLTQLEVLKIREKEIGSIQPQND